MALAPQLQAVFNAFPILGFSIPQAAIDALNAVIVQASNQGSGAGLGPQATWTPTNLPLGQEIGMFSFGDLPDKFTNIVFNAVSAIAGFDIEGMTKITSLSWPNLTSIDASNAQGGYFQIVGCPLLSSISLPLLASTAGQFSITLNGALTALVLPSLTSVGSDFTIPSNGSLTTVSAPVLKFVGALGSGNLELHDTGVTAYSFPSLVSVMGELNISSGAVGPLVSFSAPHLVTVAGFVNGQGQPSLSTLNLSAYLPTNGGQINFVGAALSAASVNQILARGVANPAFVTGNITISGGTNAPPSGQGIADKATLIGRGVTVITN